MFNTATVRSAISYIDGDKGILRYRGYPIEELAEKSTFLEVIFLQRHLLLPTMVMRVLVPTFSPLPCTQPWEHTMRSSS